MDIFMGFFKIRQKQARSILLGALAVSMFFVAGCGKSDEDLPIVQTNRMDDVEYRVNLQKVQVEESKVAAARAVIVEKMMAKMEAVKAALPTNAPKEAVDEALAKDAEWAALQEENRLQLEILNRQLENARALVRERIKKESADAAAVQAGRAKAAE